MIRTATIFSSLLLLTLGQQPLVVGQDRAMDKFGLPLSNSPSIPEGALWQTGPYCGANTVYVLLRLSGKHHVVHRDVVDSLPTNEDGSSMLDMRKLLEDYGVGGEIREVAVSELSLLPTPFIAQVSSDDRQKNSGHFVVVIQASIDRYKIIDGTDASFTMISGESFNRAFSGFVLIPRDAEYMRIIFKLLWVLVFGEALVFAVICVIWSRQLFFSDSQPVPKGR